MATNKGKPSGTYAENKKSPGKKADYKRSGWPEDASTPYAEDARGRQTGKGSAAEELRWADTAQGRDRKAGSQPLSGAGASRARSEAGTARLNRSSARRKPPARRRSPFKQMMRKETISPELAKVMREQPDKGDRRRTAAQRKLRRQAVGQR